MGFDAGDRYNNGFQEHLDEVVNRTWNRWGRCRHKKDEIINAVLGISGESGEIAELFKKGFYHAELTEAEQVGWLEALKLELGDLIFYWLKLADLFEFDHEEILDANREKLFGRVAREQAMEAKTDVT